MRILFLGDVFGKPGRRAVQRLLPRLVAREGISFVVVNCENVADGAGVDERGVDVLLASGADVLTSGNHVWRKRETRGLLEREQRLLRPANYPDGAPGRGFATFTSTDGTRIGVLNLIGRIFMDPVDCPFREAERHLPGNGGRVPMIVDMHGEASSEKAAMGWFLAGRVSAVVGTHTHVQTADARILPGGTAYISDVGMCGPVDSVIGSDPECVVERFVTRVPAPLVVASGPCVVQGVIVDIDRGSGCAERIVRIQEMVE